VILDDLAERAGLPLNQMEALLQGSAPPDAARRLGIPRLQLQEFIDGEETSSLAERLDVRLVELTELRARIGLEGAVGFVLGLLVEAESPDS